MADADFSLLSSLKAAFPKVPIKIVLKVMQKYNNDQERCQQALEAEAEQWGNGSDCNSETSSVGSASDAANSSNNRESPPLENKSIATRMRELQVCHESSSSQTKPVHVSTIERSIGNTSRLSEPKPPLVGQSVSWTVQTTDRPVTSGASAPGHRPPTFTTPQTAPPDFSPFFKSSATNIPNIDCRTSGSGSSGARPHHISIDSLSASSSPGEQRRPVKVINIPAGSLSGGSVSPAATPPNSRHIRMHFGDTGGVCTVSAPATSMQRYGSSPNVSQHFRSELRTETSVPQPVHSSSIVVNTTSHTNHLTVERKPNNSNNDSLASGRRTPNPPLTLNTENSSVSAFTSGTPLSMPVQASSPGISHSKPVFVENRRDPVSGPMHSGYNDSYPSNFYPPGNVRPPPSNSYFSMNYPRYNPDLSGATGYSPGQQHQAEPAYPQHPSAQHPGYNSSPSNLYQPTAVSGYNPNPYSHFNPTGIIGYPGMPVSVAGQGVGQTSSYLPQYTPQFTPLGSHSPALHMPKSPNIGVGQPALGSRSNSQDSEHSLGGPEFDPRLNFPYNNMGSRVSSHSSLSSDSSSARLDRGEHSARPRSGSIQEEADYIRALLQHQKSRMQKLVDDMNQHEAILNNLRSDVSRMEKGMIENSHVNKSFPSVDDISRLCENNRSLQTDIQMYLNEIDMYKSGQTPYNKITAQDQQNFFDNMPTGQQDPIYARSSDGRRTPSPQRTPPPRPPPPIPVRQRSMDPGQTGSAPDISRVPPVPSMQPTINSGDSEEGESWSCSACTFSNHPALKKCEMCEMPRVMPPHPASSIGPPALPPHHPLMSGPSHMGPGFMGNMQPGPGCPRPTLGPHHHRAGT